jgi:hypothetical protein
MRPVVPCLVLAGCLLAASTTPLEAASISFTAGVFDLTGIGNIVGGSDDELHLQAFTDTFTINVGDGVVQRKVNPFVFTVGDTGAGSEVFPPANFTVTRTFTVNSSAGSISQDATVDVGFSGDSLVFAAGLPITFNLGADGFLDVTPDGWDSNGELDVDDHFGDLTASFVLRAADPVGAAVPEPASLLLLASGLAGAGARWRKRRTN